MRTTATSRARAGVGAVVVATVLILASCRGIAPAPPDLPPADAVVQDETPDAPGTGDTAVPSDPAVEAVAEVPQSHTGRVLASGQHCAVHTPVAKVITDQATWREVWSIVYSNRVDPPPLPAIDFAAEQVVLVILGDRPTTGYSVGIAAVRITPNRTVVTIQVASPAPNAVVSETLTTPFRIVAIPRSDGPVVFAGDDLEDGFVGE